MGVPQGSLPPPIRPPREPNPSRKGIKVNRLGSPLQLISDEQLMMRQVLEPPPSPPPPSHVLRYPPSRPKDSTVHYLPGRLIASLESPDLQHLLLPPTRWPTTVPPPMEPLLLYPWPRFVCSCLCRAHITRSRSVRGRVLDLPQQSASRQQGLLTFGSADTGLHVYQGGHSSEPSW